MCLELRPTELKSQRHENFCARYIPSSSAWNFCWTKAYFSIGTIGRDLFSAFSEVLSALLRSEIFQIYSIKSPRFQIGTKDQIFYQLRNWSIFLALQSILLFSPGFLIFYLPRHNFRSEIHKFNTNEKHSTVSAKFYYKNQKNRKLIEQVFAAIFAKITLLACSNHTTNLFNNTCS